MAEPRISTRMGDGSVVRMTRSEICADVEAGTEAATRRAKLPPLEADEIDHVVNVCVSAARFTGVDLGDEVVLSNDGTGKKMFATRQQELQCFEQWLGGDMVELCLSDYSLKMTGTIRPFEAQCLHDAQLQMVVPMQYGIMPDMGRYSKPDGPCENWNELMPLARIAEARAAQEEAVEMAVEDMVLLADAMREAGADGIDWDITGASGDAEFQAVLRATEVMRKKYPDMGVEMGMAGEFVLGMHRELEYDSTRLAGLYPRQSMLLAQKAGATIFGPAVTTNTGKSCAWNMARTLTVVKPCMAEASIPIHADVGIGVGAVPMYVYPLVDVVCRSAKCFVNILKVDGL